MHRATRTAVGVTLALAFAMPALGQARAGSRAAQPCRAAEGGTEQRGRTNPDQPPQQGEYDVVLMVPDLCVDEIQLDVDNVQARVALNARVANLVRLDAGADVAIETVSLGIRGVRAEVLLLVDLDNVVHVVDRTLSFLDQNPEIVTGLFRTTQGALSTVGGLTETALEPGGVASQAVGTLGRTLDNVTAPNGLLSQTVNTVGQTVQRTVSSTGSILERTLDTAGGVVNERTLGNVARLPLVRETTNQAGQTVRRVRDETGAIIEYVAGSGGRVSDVRVVQRASSDR